jgi:hypothetical protein
MIQNRDDSWTCTVCAANHWHGPTTPPSDEVQTQRHVKRGERGSYSPRNYLYIVITRACGNSNHVVDEGLLHELQLMGAKETNEVREAMRAMGLSFKYHVHAAAYASRLGGYIPHWDSQKVETLLDAHEHFLCRFHELRRDKELPVKRKHEPHTGQTLRRLAHRLGFHEYEACFRDLRPRQKEQVDDIIATVFKSLDWGTPETCNGEHRHGGDSSEAV